MPSAKPVVIMGAGPAGLTAAFELNRAGRDVVVWEADASYVGGLARTVQAEGYRIDVGGHVFYSRSAEVNDLWRQIMPTEFVECRHSWRIFYKGKYFTYPFGLGGVLSGFGLIESAKLLWSYLQARMKPIKPEETFAQRCINRWGRWLYESFFRSHYEKLLGIPPDNIVPELAAKRLRQEQLAKTSVRRTYYPRLGPGQMWEAAANKVLERGGNVFLDRKVQTVHWDETGVTHITGTNAAGEYFQQEGSHFLSSIPLPELLLALDPPPPKEVADAARALRYRDFITVCLIVNRETVFPDAMIRIHDSTVRVAHVINYKNWSPALLADPKMTSLGLEYFCVKGDNLWSATDFDLAQIAIREAVQLGLVTESEVKDAYVVRTPKAYPLYDANYDYNLDVIKQWIGLFANLQPMGRNGMHRDNKQDHSMMTALLAVRNIQGGNFDCWKVTDDASYPTGKKT